MWALSFLLTFSPIPPFLFLAFAVPDRGPVVRAQVVHVDWMQGPKRVMLEDTRKAVRCANIQNHEFSFLTQITAH